MKKINKVSALYTVIMAVILMSTSAFAKPIAQSDDGQSTGTSGWSQGHHGQGHMHEHHSQFMESLGLTDAQKEQIKQIHANHHDTMMPLMKELHAKKMDLRQSTQNGAFNEAVVTQKLSDMAAVKAKLMGEQLKIHQETLAILTADQKAKIDQMHAQFKARRQSFHSSHSSNNSSF